MYTTPKTYIDDITVTTTELDLENDFGKFKSIVIFEYLTWSFSALLEYNVSVIGDTNVSCRVSLIDKDEYYAAFNVDYFRNFTGVLKIVKPKLWWPYLMDPQPGYLYTFQVSNTNQ